MEKFGVTHVAQISMHLEPAHQTELVSQLLFGEPYKVIDEQHNWLKIKTVDCDYEGWIDNGLYNPLHEEDVENYLQAEKYIVKDYLFFIREFETGAVFPVFIGSSFPYPQNDMLILGNAVFTLNLPEEKEVPKHNQLAEKQLAILQYASTYLRAPYLWGGRTPLGIDCSGFVQSVFKSINYTLPRDASQQALLGGFVDFFSQAEVGDVVFFDNEEKQINHTGIICGKGQIIHASGYVRIDKIDQTGIYNAEIEKYTHQLRIIKRLL